MFFHTLATNNRIGMEMKWNERTNENDKGTVQKSTRQTLKKSREFNGFQDRLATQIHQQL